MNGCDGSRRNVSPQHLGKKIPRIPCELIPLFAGRIPAQTKTEGGHNATVFPVECQRYC